MIAVILNFRYLPVLGFPFKAALLRLCYIVFRIRDFARLDLGPFKAAPTLQPSPGFRLLPLETLAE